MKTLLATLALLACLGAAPDYDGTRARGVLHDTPANVAELILTYMGCENPLNFDEIRGCNWQSGLALRIGAGDYYTTVTFIWDPFIKDWPNTGRREAEAFLRKLLRGFVVIDAHEQDLIVNSFFRAKGNSEIFKTSGLIIYVDRVWGSVTFYADDDEVGMERARSDQNGPPP